MPIAVTSPITGAAQTGFTSPTYTVLADTAPTNQPGKQVYVSALGGTQAGVTVHTVAAPFTINFTRPSTLRVLPPANPVTGIVSQVPTNTYTVVTRKGVLPLAGQPYRVAIWRTTAEIPAGADLADAPNIRAGYSAHLGAVAQQSSNMGDLAITGAL